MVMFHFAVQFVNDWNIITYYNKSFFQMVMFHQRLQWPAWVLLADDRSWIRSFFRNEWLFYQPLLLSRKIHMFVGPHSWCIRCSIAKKPSLDGWFLRDMFEGSFQTCSMDNSTKVSWLHLHLCLKQYSDHVGPTIEQGLTTISSQP